MNATVLSILSKLLMIVSITYILVYLQKRKRNEQRDIAYRVIFASIIILLGIPIIFSAVL